MSVNLLESVKNNRISTLNSMKNFNNITVSMKESQYQKECIHIINKTKTIQEAADFLHISSRNMYRILKKYRSDELQGLIHKSRGRPSNHQYNSKGKETILQLMHSEYKNHNPVHASELLQEEGNLTVHHNT